MQIVLFLVLAWLYRSIAAIALGAIDNASSGQADRIGSVVAVALVLVLDLFTALAIAWFVSRRLLWFIVRVTPHPAKPPTRPIPFISLCAGVIVAVVSIIAFVSGGPVTTASGAAWIVELLREAAIVALFWFGALRAVGPTVPA